ncbi:hypothetical protein BC628DRAFT_1405938 [Trametes gibbosa]|nr:hypothetical protein BC628DRAFT_1405938 [Trametes gibbosa]
MPFSRYLGDGHDGHDDVQDAVDHNVTFSPHVHFQLPNLILNAPSVPPGGGAEALPAGFYPPSSSLAWFSAPDGYPIPFSPAQPYHAQHPAAASPHPVPSVAHPVPSVAYPIQAPYAHSAHPYPPNLPLSIPSALGLPVYSSSGFDLLSILSRVVNRPYPKISLGPVDLSCSFVVTDTRRFDSPVVYASPSFYKLTGYDEHEVIGRNCRFLQAPGGLVHRGHDRPHTAQGAVAHLRKNIIADKECQVSIINYRKDGAAFINMVSVIPIRGGVHNRSDEADDIVFHVGFQVDLSEQPKAILSKLKDGTYSVNYSDKAHPTPPSGPRDWRTSSMTLRGMSKDLRALLADPAFVGSFQLSTSTHASTALALSASPAEPIALDPYDGNKPIHMFLLDRAPDFLHVVSLKGAFLYAAPAVRDVLGYDPDELVGRSLTELCHPADCVPLMRELKEASATPGPGGLLPTSASSLSSAGMNATADSPPPTATPAGSNGAPRPVDLLFRIQAKGRGYVWIECRGRLHVEPGKGRKAIILSGRLRQLPHLEWGRIARAGGLVMPLPPQTNAGALDAAQAAVDPGDQPPEREFWGMLSANATFLYAGAAVRDVLGWGAGEVIGKPLADFVSGQSPNAVRHAVDVEMTKILADAGGNESVGLACEVHTKDRGPVLAHIVLYRSWQGNDGEGSAVGNGNGAAQAPVVCQVKLCEGGAAPVTDTIVHAPEEAVFDETRLDRGTSWQYELQQLKFRNQRLIEEVVALEAAITKKMRRKQPFNAMSPAGTGAAVAGLGISVTARNAAAGRMGIAYAHPTSGTQQASPSQPLNVRFVSEGYSVPPPARSHPQPHLSNSISVLSPTPQMTHTGASPSMAHAAPSAYTQAQVAAAYPRPSFDSSLQGWSHYTFEAQDVPAQQTSRAGAFNMVPTKRSWDMRDPGGGGGGGGGGD